MILHETVRALMRDGKGILDASESVEELDGLFSMQGISATDDTRRKYHDLLFTTEGIEEYLSGVILSEEAMHATVSDGTPLYEVLSAKNILVGITFKKNGVGEQKLIERFKEYRSLAAVFVKHSVATRVGNDPASVALKENIRYAIEAAKNFQNESVVPVIELEVVMRGSHTAGQAEDHLIEMLSLTSDSLESGGLDLKGLILGVSMAVTGTENPLRAGSIEVAERTVRALLSSLPDSLGGIVFISSEQSSNEAAANLNALSRLEPFPWPVTFSFSHALIAPVSLAWRGKEENIASAQATFLSRLSLAEAADAGGYSKTMEDDPLDQP